MKQTRNIYFLLILILFFSSCGDISNPFIDHKKSKLVENLPPETYIYLLVDSDSTGIDTTSSLQIIHWWGDDPDGEVIGYNYQWDFQDTPVWTNQEIDTLHLPIRSAYDAFSLSVWAVDNDSLQDPTPAVLRFPVMNSKPEIDFRIGSNPSASPSNPDVIAYTFPTRTFVWDASDLDGRETIVNFRWTLDDTTTWNELDGSEGSITIRNISPGEHQFFVKAVDIAGAESEVIFFPDPSDNTTPNIWEVIEPVGDVLLVNDYALDQNTHVVQSFYQNILDDLIGPDNYTVWEIGTNLTPIINPQNTIPYSITDIEAYFSYFKKVIWFSHLGRPHITQAGLGITKFISTGGKIFITNGNEGVPDTTWTFTKIDSVYKLNPGGRLFPGISVLADFGDAAVNQKLKLTIELLIGNRVSALIPGVGGEAVYYMEPDSTAPVTVPYKGSPPVGVRYRIGQGESIYFSLPLHYCNALDNVKSLIEYFLFENISF